MGKGERLGKGPNEPRATHFCLGKAAGESQRLDEGALRKAHPKCRSSTNGPRPGRFSSYSLPIVKVLILERFESTGPGRVHGSPAAQPTGTESARIVASAVPESA